MAATQLHILGIRHHGPGSAHSVRQTLADLQPDLILVEGPPDATDILDALAHPDLDPPVALLIYAPDHPQAAVYYPFAIFSPELQAIQYGLQRQIPIRWMDLPQTHQMALWLAAQSDPSSSEPTVPDVAEAQPTSPEEVAPHPAETDASIPERTEGPNLEPQPPDPEDLKIRHDPLSWLAQAAGYGDSERWWEHMVEQRQSHTDSFAAILEAMQALREEYEQVYPPNLEHPTDYRDALREAYMRRTIRQAQRDGYQTIAVVCGAWHGPALAGPLPPATADNALLKGLPKCKVQSTWIPWTYDRLTWRSGYGAGIASPGWYEHLWSGHSYPAIHWLTKVARLLRQQDLDASSASVIEAVRLATALAALRDRPAPGLEELNEAAQTVLCFGDDLPMQLIHEQLIVSDRLGQVPPDTPLVPLQADLHRLRKTLRLKLDATVTDLELDLRKPNDLARSHLLHRLRLLQIPWGQTTYSRSKGTFKEVWRLQWQPEFELALIEAGQWGNTIEAAAIAYACDQAQKATQLPQLTELFNQVLLADLPTAMSALMAYLQAEAAIASDLAHLMEALPPLANLQRYGDVRQTDVKAIAQVINGLVIRICVGLPGACSSLDDEAAATMEEHLSQTHSAIKLLQDEIHLQSWRGVLIQLADQSQLHGVLAGRCCRLLLDEGHLDSAEAARRLNLALSTANDPTQSANWIAGFLQGSGLLLLHDDPIWSVLDQWVTALSTEVFTSLLPLLRRTFAEFSAAERRQMGERLIQGASVPTLGVEVGELDGDRARTVLPLIAQLLGLQHP